MAPITAPAPAPQMPIGKAFGVVFLFLVGVGGCFALFSNSSASRSVSTPQTLTQQHLDAVANVHHDHAWIQPVSVMVRDSFVVVDYEIGDELLIPHRTAGEERLLAIREALLPYGFKDYRVNVNGKPPGTGLTRRYGSARYIEAGGRVEWLPPPR